MTKAILTLLFLLFAVPSLAMVTERYEDGRAATIVTGMQKAYGSMQLCTIYDREYKYGDGTPYHYIAQGLLTKSSWDGRDICFLPVRRGGNDEKKVVVDETPSEPPQEECETQRVCDEAECSSITTCDEPVCRMDLVCRWRHHRLTCERERVCSEPLCEVETICQEPVCRDVRVCEA